MIPLPPTLSPGLADALRELIKVHTAHLAASYYAKPRPPTWGAEYSRMCFRGRLQVGELRQLHAMMVRYAAVTFAEDDDIPF